MRRHFRDHRAEFELLVRMSNEDFARTRVIRIAPEFTRLAEDWSWPRPREKWGVEATRWNEYRALFERLELPGGLNRDGEEYSQILLMVYGTGMAGEGTEYGFLWSPRVVEPSDDQRGHFKVKPLEGPWYLYDWHIR